MKRRGFLAASLAVACVPAPKRELKPGEPGYRPPPPAPEVPLRRDATLRAARGAESAPVGELKAGTVVSVHEVKRGWARVTTFGDASNGWVEKRAFAYTTYVIGTSNFPLTRELADRVDRMANVDVVTVETTMRRMPGGALGGDAGSKQLAGNSKAEILLGASGTPPVFEYEIYDLIAGRVLARGNTENRMDIGQLDQIAFFLGQSLSAKR